MDYNFQEIEKKWKKYWKDNKTFKTDVWDFSKPKYYALDMFPYPSGVGLHAGHVEGYTATDIMARFKRMQGYNVLHPMGWDAFGLPAEQYAINTGNHPDGFTQKNIATFKQQLENLGLSYDWDKEISTTDPSFYKWTQWIFKQLYLDGYAKLVDMPVNWCEELGTVLANDEVIDGKSERGGFPVVRKNMKQWVIETPKFAEKLLENLENLDWPESTKEIQKNWIGKSVGAQVDFKVADHDDLSFTIFTTRCDTLFGATYCVLAPENKLVKQITTPDQKSAVEEYIKVCSTKSDLERTELNKEKTGVFTGAYAINPVNGNKLPIWISDYVLSSYGTGAIMAVPAHDQRDYEFAKKFNLPIIQVIAPYTLGVGNDTPHPDLETVERYNVLVIVKHWNKDAYIALKWNTADWKSFVIGGIEDGESAEEAAIREVKEETGYCNIKTVKAFPLRMDNYVYAPHKKINRYAKITPVYIELADEKQIPTLETETKNHSFSWINAEDIENYINLENNLFAYRLLGKEDSAFTDTNSGVLINSGFLNGLSVKEAQEKMISWLEENKIGHKQINYKIHDWIFARQRYWGEPIPIINFEDGTSEALDDSELPLILPKLDNYAPSKNGDSPLERAGNDWLYVTKNGKKGKRETSTMPGSAGSSWYFLRYIDPHNDKAFADPELLKHWLPVDLYLGGPEHAVGHLIYSRIWNNYLYDKNLVPVQEPFKKLVHQGMVLGSNGIKMGKRYPEFAINPNDIVAKYGADTLRLYEMFMGPLEANKPWNENGVEGAKRFIDRVYRIFEEKEISDKENKSLEKIYNATVKKVTEDFDKLSYNTAISQLMIFVNSVYKEPQLPRKYAEGFIQLLNPIAPFITEEIWNTNLGHSDSIAYSKWPEYDESKIIDDEIKLPVQINGKLKATVMIPLNSNQETVNEIIKNNETISSLINSKTIVKEIYVPNKIYNIVIK